MYRFEIGKHTKGALAALAAAAILLTSATAALPMLDVRAEDEGFGTLAYNSEKRWDKIEADSSGWVGFDKSQPRAVVAGKAPAGERYILTTSRDSYNSLVLERIFSDAVDLSSYGTDGYLNLWVYVDNKEAVAGGQINLSSDGKAWTIYTAWDLKSSLTKNGWNLLSLPLSAMTTTGNVDLSAINYMRVYAAGINALGLDNVYLSKKREGAETDTLAVDTIETAETAWKTYVIRQENVQGVEHACDQASATVIGKAPAGERYAVIGSKDAFGNCVLQQILGENQTKDFSAYAQDGYLHMWVYVDRKDGLNGQINLSDDVVNAADALTWNVADYVQENGWNELYLPIEAAIKKADTEVDFSKLSFLRIYANGLTSLGLDDVYFCLRGEAGYGAEKRLDEIEADTTGWTTWKQTGAAGDPPSAEILSATVKSGEAPAGTYYIQSATLDTWGNHTLEYTLKEAKDFTGYESGFLHVWVYVDSADKIGIYPRIELSSGNIVTDAIGWNLIEYITQDGWNELYLPLAAVTQSRGTVDLAAISYMRAYVSGQESAVLGLDDVYFCREGNEPPVEEKPPVQKTYGAQKWLDKIESDATAWTTWKQTGAAGDPPPAELLPATVKSSDAPAGTYYIQSDTLDSWGNHALEYTLKTAKNFTGYEAGYLHAWVYVDSAAKVGEYARIELSSGDAVTDAIGWDIRDYIAEDGWNELYLPMEETTKNRGTVDLAQIRYMRAYVNGLESSVLGLDDVYFCREGNEPPVEEKPAEKVYGAQKWFDKIEAANTGWKDCNEAAATMERQNAPVGTYFVSTTAEDIFQHRVLQNKLSKAKDFSGYENGYLHMWVYVDSRETLENFRVEISSSGSPDGAKTWENVGAYLTGDGWNEVYLPLSAAETAGSVELSRLDYMRVYARVTTRLALDDVYFCREGNEPPVEEKEPDVQKPTVFGAKRYIDHVDALEGWYLDTGAVFVPDGAPDKNGYLETEQVNAFGALMLARKYDKTLDLSRYAEEGYLHIWLKLENAVALTDGSLELSSAGQADVDEIHWGLSGMELQDGWNELYLPFSEAAAEGGTIDVRAVNFFRIYTYGAVCLGIDDIYACLPGENPDTGVSPLCAAIPTATVGAAAVLYACRRGKKKNGARPD